MKVKEIRKLSDKNGIKYVTVDPVVRATSSNLFNQTVGLEQYFEATRSRTVLGYDGNKDHRIAIFNSGLADHDDIGGKIEKQVDFTTGQSIIYKNLYDPFGHGTHVARIIGGKGTSTKGTYLGLATENKYVIVRVLGADGSGSTSNVIQAIDWVISQQEKLKIRVANLHSAPGRPLEHQLLFRPVRLATLASGPLSRCPPNHALCEEIRNPEERSDLIS